MITQNNFPEIHSTPNWFRTWLIRGIFIAVVGTIVLLQYTIPILFYADGTVSGEGISIFSAFYYPLMIWMSVLAFQYFKRLRGNAIIHIRVNKEGVFYGILHRPRNV